MKKISLETEDHVTIIGNYFSVAQPKMVALLLHMMPATKESFTEMQTALADKNISSLAIDLRGHGESASGEVTESFLDVQAALAWMKNESGLPLSQTIVIGASIGANLAIQAAAVHADIPSIIALSPGLVYGEIATMALVSATKKSQRLLLIASDDDAYSNDTIEKLAERTLSPVTVWHEHGIGHGTRMLENDSTLLKKIMEWIG